ncbi:MAG: hypothetical protein ABI297_05925 [Ginsengibacter sp.]
MKKAIYLLIFAATCFTVGCSSSKNATNLKPTTGHLAGNWIISNIDVDVPSDFMVTNVFDEAPYKDFQNSSWDLIRNGKGNFALANGTKEEIYWSIYGKGNDAQFQFKKLNGKKAKNVDDGYRLKLDSISNNRFKAISTIDVGKGNTGAITYTFIRK